MAKYRLHLQNNPAVFKVSFSDQTQVDLSPFLPKGYTLRISDSFSCDPKNKIISYPNTTQVIDRGRVFGYPHLDYYFLTLLHEIGHGHTHKAYLRQCSRWRKRVSEQVWWERAAWSWALHTYRDLKHWGMPFETPARDLLRFVNQYSLGSYEREFLPRGRAGFWRGPLEIPQFVMHEPPPVAVH